jgi:hypothetical protein
MFLYTEAFIATFDVSRSYRSRRPNTFISCLPSQVQRPRSACYLIHAGFFLGLFFDPEDGGNIFLRNVCRLSTGYTALCP